MLYCSKLLLETKLIQRKRLFPLSFSISNIKFVPHLLREKKVEGKEKIAKGKTELQRKLDNPYVTKMVEADTLRESHACLALVTKEYC